MNESTEMAAGPGRSARPNENAPGQGGVSEAVKRKGTENVNTVPHNGHVGVGAALRPDVAAIRAALPVLFDPADVVELRAFPKGGRKNTVAGYFDGAHWADLANHAAALSRDGAAVYVTLNPVDTQLLNRYFNRVEAFAKTTTTDKQVARRRWLLIDLDPVRPTDTGATEAQVQAARIKTGRLRRYLDSLEWPAPVVAGSGNGFHLLYAIDLPNDDDAAALLKGALQALGERFDDSQTKVDRGVFNAARICKMYGTVACKGDNTPAAPHRLSRLIETPARVEVSEAQLRALLSPEKPPATAPPSGARTAGTFNLGDFLAKHDLEHSADAHDGTERFKLARCPFNEEHGRGESAIFRRPSGALGFKCQHDSCAGKRWQDVRELLEPRARHSSDVPSKPAGFKAANPPADDWPDLQPLIAKIDPEPYPTDALPGAVRQAVEEVAGFVKAPVPLIAVSALAALSLAIQAHHDVERAGKLSGPCSLFLLAIADSGERKSTCDGFFTKSIRDHEAAQQEAAKPLLTAYRSDREIWEAQRAGLKDKIRLQAKTGKSSKSEERELRELDKAEPQPPRVARLIYGDATPEALTYALAKQWPSGVVLSSDAGTVFGSHGMGKDSVMRNLTVLNHLWDAAPLPVARRSTESFTVRGARLSMALQVQEATLRAFFDSTKGLARGTGFLARFLVAWPTSTQGMRPFTEAPANWPALAAFNGRLAAILNRPVPIDDDGALTPAMLKLAPDAKAAWVAFHDQIEAMLSTGGELYDVRDVASKIADNAARMAALFHVFEGSIGPIGVDAMESAARIAAWHLNEARRFLGELAMPAEVAHPLRLESWLLDYCRRENTDMVPTRAVQQFGPGGLRDKAAIGDAVRELVELGRACVVQDGRKKLIHLNPAVLEASS